jgi:F-type H+-transporting ATPase subunit gamma
MSLGLAKTKRRIVSIRNTEKITKAMELIATVKLKKFKDARDKGSVYAEELSSLMATLFAFDSAAGSHYARLNEGDLPTLYVVIASDLGLCGSYNSSLYRYVGLQAGPHDVLAVIGARGRQHFAREGRLAMTSDYDYLRLSTLDFATLRRAAAQLKNDFNAKKYARICLIHTHYANSMSYYPEVYQLLPVELHRKKWEGEDFCPPLFDEPPRALIHRFMPDYLLSVLYYHLVESELSEQASRRTAMDNANDNADKLLDQLTVEYNKARQNAITQEITEVVNGALTGRR